MNNTPKLFDVCRTLAKDELREYPDMNATEYRDHIAALAVERCRDLGLPYPEHDIRDTAAGCASWARNHLLAGIVTLKDHQRLMARRRNALAKGHTPEEAHEIALGRHTVKGKS